MKNQSSDLKNMRTMVSILKDMERNNYIIILNESMDTNKTFFSLGDIKNIVKRNVDYTIPSSFYIKNIDKYVLNGEIITLNNSLYKKHNKGYKKLEKIAENLIKEKVSK
jgi:MinD-like ATPase involved in chromosome partitioning or flagellar assembly